MAQALPHASFQERPEVPVDGRPRGEGRWRWKVAPLAAGPYDVEQRIQQSAHVRAARTSAGLRRWEQRLDQAVLVIAQSLTGAVIANQPMVLGRPHRRSPVVGFPVNSRCLGPSPPQRDFRNGLSVPHGCPHGAAHPFGSGGSAGSNGSISAQRASETRGAATPLSTAQTTFC